ncbi:MAG: hypothetical protein AAFR87_21680 [Bacteroidota bacterium]
MKAIRLFMISVLVLATWACTGSKTGNVYTQMEEQTSTTKEQSFSKAVYEIAVRVVKDGMKEDFVRERSAFISALTAEEGVSNDREFQSFYALPAPDEREVFIGMTQYASAKTLEKVQGNIYEKFLPFAKTMDLKAYVFVQPIEGGDFELKNLAAQSGQVLEVAVRRVKEGQENAFQSTRKEFVDWLNAQEGVKGSWEFKVISGQDTERLTVGMSVYENKEKFMAISAQVQQLEAARKYFATFDPVALQYAVSISNQ